MLGLSLIKIKGVRTSISFIIAMDRNQAIDLKNVLPWHLPGGQKTI
ncbi:hypothetical protein [Paenibacillus roseipurpureus]|uniref:Uncharacterized protein n=1 Tax=Paenibacillus roseopurpureus TaxID=2918901 RepID=A0AA96RH40_9BACL|nr:hypothetical protein [Paenibacillus sp. MBLB1832]WNR42903.1 hypothetical protein MJB10_17485 [Paenibacillus sp. MBLB1832]